MLRLLLLSTLLLGWATTAYAQPANDSCATAITIELDSVVMFSTIDATSNGPDHPDCFGPNATLPADIWFVYTPETDGALRWSNCFSADYDSRMAVYAVADPCMASDDNLVQCNDDGPDCDNFASQLDFFGTGGQTYVFRLGGFNGDDGISTGQGTVTLTTINTPLNDNCSNGTTVTLGVGQAFTTVNALTDGPDHPDNPCFGFGSLTAGADVWYDFTPDFTGFVEWSTCSMATFDTRLAVYDPTAACPPINEDLYACNDDGPGCSEFSSNLIFGVVAGQTYKLRLGGYGGASGTGTFDLTMVTPPDPPVNDFCENAIPVSLVTRQQAEDFDTLTTGTTISATFESEGYLFPPCLFNQNGGEFADVWYSFQTLGNTEIDIQILPVNESAQFFFLDIFSSCTERADTSLYSGTCTFTEEDNLTAETTLTGLPAGEDLTLYVRVSSRLTSDVPGEFAFQISADVVTDVEDPLLAGDLQFFPNPVTDRATVRFNLLQNSRLNATIVDMFGRRVQQLSLGQLSSGRQQIELNTQDLAPGVYSLQISDGERRHAMKFVVQ